MKIVFNREKEIIKIVAPASKKLGYESVMKSFSLLCKEYSCNYSVSEGLFSETCLAFISNNPEYRFKDFLNALDDDKVRIIWSIRGGYGSAEIANLLLDYKIKSPKILIGFSDITSLHLLFNNYFNLPSIHGSMPFCVTRELGMQNLRDVFEVLLNVKKIEYKLENISFSLGGERGTIPDFINGDIIGGNLTVLCSNIGSLARSQDFDGKILFLEDVDEKSYKIQRSLMQLYQGGLLKNIKAIIFGQFIEHDEYIDETIINFVEKNCHGKPAFRLNYIGHGKVNKPLIMGAPSIITEDCLIINNPFEWFNC